MGHGLWVMGYRSDSEFPDFLLSPFHLFRRPVLVQAAFAADSLSVKLKFKSADPRSVRPQSST